MFGTIGPRLVGGLSRLHQAFSAGIAQFKGPIDLDLKISAGDRVFNSVSKGLSLWLEAGAPTFNTGVSTLTGGDVNITAGLGVISAAGGVGGTVNITGGQGCQNAGASGNGGPINITGGRSSTVSVGDGNGGIVTIAGGASGANSGSGGKVTIQGGNAQTGSAAGAIEVFAGTAVSGGTGANVTIRPGSAVTNKGNILLDGGIGAALATNAAGGFVQIPTCAGVPTGVPTVATGMAPIVFDSTNLKIMVFTGGAWKGVVVA